MPSETQSGISDGCCSSFSRKWTQTLRTFTKPILVPFLALSNHAAKHPRWYILGTILLSIGIMAVGIFTNFEQNTDDDIWTPQGSKPVEHGNWVTNDSNFPVDSRTTVLVVHRDGKNLFGDDGSLAVESARRMFESLDQVRNTPRYDELCSLSSYIPPSSESVEDATPTCQIVAATSFWNESTELFESSATSNQVVLEAMSQSTYPSGGAVDHDQLIGFNTFDDNGVLTGGQSYVLVVFLPPDKGDEESSTAFSKDFEKEAIDRILELQDQWAAEEGNDFKVEIITDRSFEDEFGRAITGDLPLLPSVFLLMSVLCIILYARRNPVHSRSWLGFGAVATVLLAITASFGLMFTIGVPFTSLTPLLPFIMFGVGLDNAFIISGAFARTDPKKEVVERIDDTMNDIGQSILLTSMTSALAFGLGAVSSIPAVRFLVMYAFPTIIIDYLFQITFFVALLVIDEKRVQANRRDCCFCCRGKSQSNEEGTGKDAPQAHFADRVMRSYATFLLNPIVRWIVIVLFTTLLGLMSWRTSELRQYFDFTNVIPSDSYIQTWFDAYDNLYEANGVRAGVYFRDVDFSDPDIQNQMEAYLAELAAMPYAGENEPFQFWLWDFKDFIENDESVAGRDLSFEVQIKLFLENPLYFDSYNEDIVLDENGVMTASRTLIRLDNVEETDVLETVDVLELQRSISANQPINQGKSDWSFFTFSGDYYIWEFYRVSPDELRLTTIIGVVSVSILALIFIPHWSAIFFVGPLVSVLYIDLLGFIELCGLHVNPVMYISTVMSIGLMVDFLMHVALRYVETEGTSRVEKTKETLETIGASVLLGGFSTLVGVLPLALSSSEIFFTTFIIFFGLVLLGLLHGLVLLPVLLSMFGPRDSIGHSSGEVQVDDEKDIGATEHYADDNSA